MMSVKHRAIILGVLVLAAIALTLFWEKPPGYELVDFPEPNWIGSTWYGPVLLIAIPVCLAWLSWGSRNELIKGIGLVLSVLVAGASIFLIALGRDAATGWM
jgi:hypothetical protein